MNLTKDFDKIQASLIERKGKKRVNFEVYINNGVAIFVSNNQKFTERMVENENAKGNGNIRLQYQPIGKIYVAAAVEHFEGMSKDEVKKKVIRQLGKAGAKLNG